MPQRLASPSLYFVLRLIVGGVFVFAGSLKLADTGAFAMAIDAYGLVPWATAKFLSHTLPVFEILTGLGLILDIRGALSLIVAQLLVFMGVVGYAVHLGLNMDCGCFGPSAAASAPSGDLRETLFRDAALLLACGLLYFHRWRAGFAPRSPLPPFHR